MAATHTDLHGYSLCWKLPNDDFFDVRIRRKPPSLPLPLRKLRTWHIPNSHHPQKGKPVTSQNMQFFWNVPLEILPVKHVPLAVPPCRSLAVATASAPERLAEKMVERLQQLSRSLMWRCEEIKQLDMVCIICICIWYMYTCIHICLYIYIHTCIHVHVYLIYMYIHTCILAYMYIYIFH